MFFALLFSGFLSLTSALSHQYHFVNESKTWSEAQSYCRANYTDLATLYDTDDVNALIQLASPTDSAWIGLYADVLNSWRWSITDSSFYGPGETTYRNWASGEPNDRGGEMVCVVMDSLGTWIDVSCETSRNFVCYGFFPLSSALSHQYHFVNEPKTWSEAQSYCRAKHTDLATLYNTDDVNALTQLGSQTGSAWIGLYDDLLNGWRWSITDSSFYGPGETTYRNWDPNFGNPSNSNANELCVEMFIDGTWNDFPCTYSVRSFVCYGVNDTYILITTKLSWNDAQIYCRANYIDLASIRNSTENQKVLDVTNDTNVIIGLYRTRTWSDGSDSSFRNWKSRQPDNANGNQLCTAVSFSDSGHWTDENCGTTRPFFCYSATVVGLRMVVQAKTDLNEAEIDEMILKPFLEKLIENGLPSSTTVRLRRVHLGLLQASSTVVNAFNSACPQYNDVGASGVAMDMPECQHKPTIITGLFPLSSALSHQYHFVNEPKNWSEAQSYCRANYTDLATLYDTDDVNALTQLGSQTGSAWIGLHDDLLNSWRWSITDSSFYGPGETTHRNWSAVEPNNFGGKELCVEMFLDGTWNDIPCDTVFSPISFVCYGVNDTYVLNTTKLSWNDAQASCRANYIDLASIRNSTENQKVHDAANGNRVYIGLYRTRLWSDGSDSSFRNWKSGQPDNANGNQLCTAVSFSDSGQWTDENCSTTRPFFCYSAFVVGLRMVVDTETDLTEAEIEEVILKSLREELIENGLPNSTTVRLRRVHRINT
ncbi:macrophage mannose receptor 1-like [Sardina pilchardus]|uniref:macrophage mannose receptor 1-like n=1 Tax=Sardina pilchardus TaxID=27697 RepID=UPI002E13F85F